ncbi:MAG TPA: flavin-dependent oxidoreductase [Casimicrobiaceae bacterium]|nr:flavin-dependent oxidoreductase [Casimicrobiaceae bacterium]
MEAIIVGAGIGGLTLALTLHEAGIPSHIYESATEIRPIGAGINVLPHASRVLCGLGLEDSLAHLAVTTRESVFFNRFGQRIYGEPAGRYAGYDWPQFSIHRGDLQQLLLETFRQRVGPDRLHAGCKCVGFEQSAGEVRARLVDVATGAAPIEREGDVLIACDGLHSIIRKQLHPHEGEPLYSGVNMWRGVTVWEPILSGASMIRAGWLATGKLVIYPIRDRVDAKGRQLVNWVAELATPRHAQRDWNRRGALADFIGAYEDWHFDWLDVPAFIRAADTILEFPMIDQDPLPWWSDGRVTLLGDAAHPMYPRGSNGAGQAILDARSLADCLSEHGDVAAALKAYESARLEATASVVRANRSNPPDAILREVFERTGDKPFARIDDVISPEELAALSDGYKRIAGYHRETLARTQVSSSERK